MKRSLGRALGALTMLTLSFAGFACDRTSHGAEDLPEPRTDVDAAPDSADLKTAVLGGGCFWCVEAVFEQLEGVTEVVSGYAGGQADTADYRSVTTGDTGHAEVVRVTYDPSKLSFGDLLRVHFATHDPTTLNRQGNDVGPQYRSAVFYADDEEKRVAQAYIDQLNESDTFSDPVVTTVEPLDEFFLAEDYHQDFAEKHPDHPYIRYISNPKVEKVKKLFAHWLGGDPATK